MEMNVDLVFKVVLKTITTMSFKGLVSYSKKRKEPPSGVDAGTPDFINKSSPLT